MTEFDLFLHAVLTAAEYEARQDQSPTVEAQHLLLAIAGNRESATEALLSSAGLDRDGIRAALHQEFEHSLRAAGVPLAAFELPAMRNAHLGSTKLGASAKLAMERGFATVPRKKDLRPAHLLLGILLAQHGTVPRALALSGVDRDELVERTRQAIAPVHK